MAEAAKEQDQSMEEILQSIKRIIADEGDAPAAAPSAAAPDTPPPTDVLELTDMLADDGSVRQAGKEEAPSVPMMSIDEIMAAPIGAEAPAEPASPPPVAAVPEAPVTPPPSAAAPAAEEPLLSDKASDAALAALRTLDSVPPPSTPQVSGAMPFRNGGTVEDLVVEALRPMLKEWLDGNLPIVVERLVDREVRRLSSLR